MLNIVATKHSTPAKLTVRTSRWTSVAKVYDKA